MSGSISEGKVATILLHFEEFLRKAGKLNMFDTLVYNYRLRTSLTQEALRDFSSNLTNFLIQVRNVLNCEGSLDSFRLTKDANSGRAITLSTNIRINSNQGSGSRRFKSRNRKKLDKMSKHLEHRPLEQPNISIMNSQDYSDHSLGTPEDSEQNEMLPMISNEDLPFFSCSNCSNAYKTRKSFNTHPCVQENKPEKDYLIDDLETLLKVRRFLCAQCRQEFRSYSRIVAHLSKCESGPYPCELCNSSQTLLFSTMKSLNVHKNIVHKHDRSFICNECGHSFAFKSSLLKHKSRTHENPEKIFKCESCDKIFTKRIILTNHKLKHHQVQAEKKFNCERCPNSYMSSSSLRAHLEIRHKQTKRFQCEFCDKEFLRKDKLQIHASTHTGVKPFICEICGKSFSRKSKLTDHQARHLGEKKYVCTVTACSKSYASNADLKIHLRNIHPDSKAEKELVEITKRKSRPKSKKAPKTKLKVQAEVSCAAENADVLVISPEVFQDDTASLVPLVLSMDDDPNEIIQIQNPFNYDYDPEGTNFQVNTTEPAESQCVLPSFVNPLPEFGSYSTMNSTNLNPSYEMYVPDTVQQTLGHDFGSSYQEQYTNMMMVTNPGESTYQNYQMQMQYNYSSSNTNVNMSLLTESHTQHFGFAGNNGLNQQIHPQHQPFFTDPQTQIQGQNMCIQGQTMVPSENEFSEYGLYPTQNYPNHTYNQF